METTLLGLGEELLTVTQLRLPFRPGEARYAELGKSIGIMTQLEELDVEGHAITELKMLGRLKTLYFLNMTGNCIREIDPICKLTSLRVLNLSSNFIENIPTSISLLAALQRLDLSENALVSFAQIANIGKCPSLYWLNLSSNPICTAAHYRKQVLVLCNGLISLDFEDVPSGSRMNEDIKDIVVYKQNGQDKSIKRLVQENQQLKTELEATTQLLARKTTEWSVAEEHASRLQQELAFMKIDGAIPVGYHASPSRTYEDLSQRSPSAREKVDSEIMEETRASVARVENSPSWSERARQSRVNGSTMTEPELPLPLAGHDVDRLNYGSRGKSFEILNASEEELKRQRQDAKRQTDLLKMDYNKTKQDIGILHQKILKLSKSETNEDRVNDLSKSDVNTEITSAYALQKERDVKYLYKLVENLRKWRQALSKKASVTQDMIILLTENRVLGSQPATHVNKRSKLDLMTMYNRVSAECTALGTQVSLELLSTMPKLGIVMDLSNLDVKGMESIVSIDRLNETATDESMFDPVITSLSEENERTKEYELKVKQCMDYCLNRIEQVEASIAAVAESGCLDDELPRNFGAQTLQTSELSQTHIQLKASLAKLREIELSMLQIKNYILETESKQKEIQCTLLLNVIDSKDLTIDACNRTILRIEHSHSSEPRDDDTSSLLSETDSPNLLETTTSPAPSSPSSSYDDNDDHEDAIDKYENSILEDLVEQEKKLHEHFNELIDVYLIPMRRRSLLPPRDLHAIAGNIMEVNEFHQYIYSRVCDVVEPKDVIDIFHKHLNRFNVYKLYIEKLAYSMGTTEARMHQVYEFHKMLSASKSTSQSSLDILDLLRSPLQQLIMYEETFSKLVSLNDHAESQFRKVAILAVVRELLDEALPLEKLSEHAHAIAAVTRALPSHPFMTPQTAAWLSEKRLEMKPFTLIGETELVDTAVFSKQKQICCFPRVQLLVFSSFAVLAVHPLRWRESFFEELPKLHAFYLIDGKWEYTFPNLVKTQGDIPPSEKLFAFKGTHGDAQIVFQFKSGLLAKRFHLDLEELATASETDKKAPHENSTTRKENSEKQETTHEKQDNDDTTTFKQAKLPGTDMIKRREQAKALQDQRSTWDGKIWSTRAAEEARKRILVREGGMETHRIAWQEADRSTRSPPPPSQIKPTKSNSVPRTFGRTTYPSRKVDSRGGKNQELNTPTTERPRNSGTSTTTPRRPIEILEESRIWPGQNAALTPNRRIDFDDTSPKNVNMSIFRATPIERG